ncbi:MAG TPA: MlaD family protein [Myxococcaceae bacterium]|jgi:phospholipid/cholesterol/gamma-HCH transport system substrate-binding protein
MDERRLEVRVGAVLLVCLAAVGGLLWLMGTFNSITSRGRLHVRFAHTGHVTEGAPVKLGGVQVGRVDRIRLLPDRRDDAGASLPITMELSLSDEARRALHADVSVTVATVGPLGEPYLELEPGTATAPLLPTDAEVRGVEAVRLDQVAARMGALLDAVAKTLEENPGAVASLLRGVGGFSETAGGVLKDNRDQIRTLLEELTAAAKQMNALARAAQAQLPPGEKTARMMDDAQRALAGLAAATKDLTPEDGKRAREALASYAAAGEKLDRIAGRAERVLARLEAGEGTLGALQKDDQLYKDLRDLVADLKAHPWKVLWKQ